MKLPLPAALMVFLLLSFAPDEALASHSMGADLSYRCLGGDSFLVRLNFYRDCAGILPSNTTDIAITSNSCVISNTYTLPLASITPNPDTLKEKICSAQASQSTCDNGTIPGVQVWAYEAIIVLPAHCADWVISFDLCCRNDSVTNLLNPGAYDLYVEARLNNTGGICNNSPIFTTDPIPYTCLTNTQYNHGAVDPDGDSLVYTLINPLSLGAPIPYTSGFTVDSPFATLSGFIFDSITGQMSFTPSRRQSAVVTVLVEEYRNGMLVGSTMRDIQIVIFGTTACNKPLVQDIMNLNGGVLIDGKAAQVCPQQSINFEFRVVDTVATNVLTVTSNVQQAIPGASVNFSGSGDTVTGFFSWVPTGADTGVNVFTVTARNDACPIRGEAVVNFQIYVLDGTDAGPDRYYCPAGGPVQLNAFGGNVFSWTPASGLSNPNVRNPLASPAVSTDYIVTSDLTGQCKNKDTVTVFVVPDFIMQLSPDDTICRNGSATLRVTTSAQFAPYTYSWTPAATLLHPATATPTAFPQFTTTYHVAVTSATGCTIRDSVKVVVSGVGPLVEVTADRNRVCPGDSVQLQGVLYPLACGETVNGCSLQNLPSPKTFGNGTTTFFGTPFAGSNEDAKYQALYLASDLRAAGINSGTITRIDFIDSVKASTGVYENLTIRIGCTNATELSVSRGWEPAPVVVYGPTFLLTNPGVLSFPLATPYDWDGLSNLVIEICFNNPSLSSPGGDDQLKSMTVNYVASMRNYTNNTDGCTLNPLFSYNTIPNTIFHICDPLLSNYTFSWTPAGGLSSPAVINPKAQVNGPVTYTLVASDSICEGTGFISLDIDNSYGIKAIPDTTICGSNPVQLNAIETGSPPKSVLPCGVNGTQCFGTPITRQVGFSSQSGTIATPYLGFWEDGRAQFLYRKADLNAVGISGSGTISEIAFSVTLKFSTTPYSGFTIKMGCTTLNTVPANFVSGLTTVYGPVNYNTVQGWNTHVLSNPYDWDGISNIIVEVCFDNSGFSDYDDVNYTITTGNTVLRDVNDADVGCTLNLPLAYNQRPNTRFKFCAAPPGTVSAVWSPAATLSNPNIKNPVATPSVTTTYTVAYTFINGCTRTDSVTVNVVSFNASAGPDKSFCKGGSAQLTITGGDLFIWNTLPGLSCYNCRNPIASPDTTTAYTVTITDFSGSCVQRDTVTVTVFESPPIKFYNDSVYCFVSSLDLDAGLGFTSYSWNTGDVTRKITLTQPGLYSVTVTDSNGCVQSDSIRLENRVPPTVSLCCDTVTCAGNSVTLNAGSGYAGYSWNTGATDSSITVFTTGNYAVTVVDANNCPAIDTAAVTFSTPDVDFGPDVTLCTDDTLVLIAGRSYNNYLWSDGTTDTFIIATSPDTFSVIATDTLGCIDRDTLALSYYPGNPVDIGPDKSTCNNRPVIFNAGTGYIIYMWSDNTTGQTISPATAGTYSVTVIDNNGCSYTDSAVLTDETPTVTLGGDVEICQGETHTFDVANPNFTAYNWNTGSAASSITVSTSDVYSVTVTQGANCTATDNVRLTVNNLPQPFLGANDSVCPPHILYPGTFETYLWSDNSSDTILIVTQSGTYSVTVTDKNHCLNFDSVELAVYEINLTLDNVLLCEAGDSAILRAPSTGIDSYLWSTGSTDSFIIVKNPGTYNVTVIYADNCVTDVPGGATVSFDAMSVVATANPVFIGINDSSSLNADVSNGSGAYDYAWSPAETLNDSTLRNPEAKPQSNTTYTVIVTDLETGCRDTASVDVIVNSRFTVPDAFTPNGDNFNEIFKIIPTGYIEVQEFRIYNRWGELLSEDITGWNGTYKGKEQPVGTYTYYAVVRLANGETRTQKGAFSLIR